MNDHSCIEQIADRQNLHASTLTEYAPSLQNAGKQPLGILNCQQKPWPLRSPASRWKRESQSARRDEVDDYRARYSR